MKISLPINLTTKFYDLLFYIWKAKYLEFYRKAYNCILDDITLTRLLFSLLLYLLYNSNAYSQNWRTGVTFDYGVYNLEEIADYQSDLLLDAQQELEVPFTINDNFPNHFGYGVNFGWENQKILAGVELAYRSTGGKFSYSDFSGRLSIETILNSIELRAKIAHKFIGQDNKNFLIFFSPGVSFTQFNFSSSFELYGLSKNQEELNFGASSLIVGVGIDYEFLVVKNIFLGLFVGYDLLLPGDLQKNDLFLVTDNGDKISINWSGARTGLRLQFRINSN